MDSFQIEESRSTIRIGIDGEWSCAEFGAFLDDTNDIYRRLNSIFVLRQLIDQEASRNRSRDAQQKFDERDYSWRRQFFGANRFHPLGSMADPAAPYSKLIELSNSIVPPLQVDAISYGSAGWIELIGNLNPLKVLADFVSKWRAENTKRDANRDKAEVDRMRIQADLARTIFEQLPKTQGNDELTSRLVDVAQEIIDPTKRYLGKYGNDTRIIDAEIVPPRKALPPKTE